MPTARRSSPCLSPQYLDVSKDLTLNNSQGNIRVDNSYDVLLVRNAYKNLPSHILMYSPFMNHIIFDCHRDISFADVLKAKKFIPKS